MGSCCRDVLLLLLPTKIQWSGMAKNWMRKSMMHGALTVVGVLLQQALHNDGDMVAATWEKMSTERYQIQSHKSQIRCKLWFPNHNSMSSVPFPASEFSKIAKLVITASCSVSPLFYIFRKCHLGDLPRTTQWRLPQFYRSSTHCLDGALHGPIPKIWQKTKD